MSNPDHSAARKLWRTAENGKTSLIGRRCDTCGKRSFSPTIYCDACLGESFSEADLGSCGVLYTFSEVHVAPKEFTTPYVVGYVDFDPDIRVFAQLEGEAASFAPGDSVEAVVGEIRRGGDGERILGYKFRRAA